MRNPLNAIGDFILNCREEFGLDGSALEVIEQEVDRRWSIYQDDNLRHEATLEWVREAVCMYNDELYYERWDELDALPLDMRIAAFNNGLGVMNCKAIVYNEKTERNELSINPVWFSLTDLD